MTSQRALKQLVRERMQRTGESYTTAHRQVTAQRPTQRPAQQPEQQHPEQSHPTGITPNYPGFGAEEHRPSALARHLLAQSGLDMSEAIACGLGGGIGFLYAVFEYKQVDHPLLTIVAQHHPQPWLDATAEHLGFTLSSVTSSAAPAALGKLDATLERGQVAQLVVGRGLLPWHDDVPAEEAADPYPVVLAGRDGDSYFVDDGDAQPHTLDRQQLAAAWAAHRKGKFAIVTVPPLDEGVDLAAGIRSAIGTTVAHLTGAVLGNSFDVNMGLSGMEKLVAELRDTTTKTGWARRFGDQKSFAIGMSRLADCLTWAHTAVGATRPLYSRFLTEAAPIAGLQLDQAAAAADAAGQLWIQIADAADSAATTGADPASTFALVADLVEEALGYERVLVGELREALSGSEVARG